MSRKELSPTPEQIRDLRMRHHLTQEKLAESLYGVTVFQVRKWEIPLDKASGRNCPPIVWWAMKLTWDGIDLWNGEDQ